MRSRGVAAALMLAVALLLAPPARALDPERSIAQYKHTRWTRADGAPSPINGIAQTRDGYLWLCTSEGLFRFDGITFERVDSEVKIEDEGAPIRLFVANNGDLWTWYPLSRRFGVYRGGSLHMLPAPKTVGTVIQIVQTQDGAIWAGQGEVGQPLMRYHGGRWQLIYPTQSLGLGRESLTGMLVADDGALWVSYVHHVLRLPRGATKFEIVVAEEKSRLKMSLDKAHRIWGSGGAGTRLLSGPGGRPEAGLPQFRYPTSVDIRPAAAMFDRDGNLWLARRSQGLERIRTPSPLGPRGTGEDTIDRYRAEDGLTSDATTALFEDRDGNIWIGTTQGLERFRNANIVVEPLLTKPAIYADLLYPASDGQVYIGEGTAVFRVPPRGAPIPVLTGIQEPEAICEDRMGTLWVVLIDRIVGLQGNRRQTLARPQGIENKILDCRFDRWNRMWLSAGVNGVFRRTQTGWDQIAPEPVGDKFYPGPMMLAPDGLVWLVWSDYRIARLDENGRTIFPIVQRERFGDMRHTQVTAAGVLLVGSRGIGRITQGRMAFVNADRMPALRGARGVVFTPQGETWAFSRQRITRMRTADIDRAFREPGFTVPARTFDVHDGLPDYVSSQTWDALVRGGDGRIWASTLAGTVWIDPARISFNRNPPPVAIGSLVAEGRRYRDPMSLRLPAGTSDLVISYAALSLAIPERVQMRYRLEGHDAGWVDPGRRRQAFYTNLAPGNYRFRVIAANEDGVWNRQGASLDFTIPPTFLQSIWFKLLCALALGGLGWAAYKLHVQRLKTRLQTNFDVRIAERERIARELHDTLLQSFQGVVLFFQSLADRIPPDSALRTPIEKGLDHADAALAEGRDRVRELRSEAGQNDLAQALRDAVAEMVTGETPRFRLIVEGTPRPLYPLVSEEVLRIAQEAVRNAIQHAGASTIEVALTYAGKDLRLIVQDDGVGIPESVLASGSRDGHYGIVGMRERAEQIGGRFSLASRTGAGTEMLLTVPARIAYRNGGIRWRDRLHPDRWRPGIRRAGMAA